MELDLSVDTEKPPPWTISLKPDKKNPELQHIMHPKKKDFIKLRTVGSGATGKVFLVKSQHDGNLYAMKVTKKSDMIKQNKIKRLLTQREILITAQHPFIVTLHWCWHEKDAIYFIMDYCEGGDLFELLRKYKKLPEKSVQFYCAEVLVALEYLHSLGYVYRDLKPENVLIDLDGHIKLADFDLAKVCDSPLKPQVIKNLFGDIKISNIPNITTNSFVGTSQYLAPEIIQSNGHSSTVDWWTFGVLMYELLYGTTPFKGKTTEELFENITKEKVKFPKKVNVSKDAKNLIRSLLTTSKKRLGSECGASDIKDHAFFKNVNWALLRSEKVPFKPKVVEYEIDYSLENNSLENEVSITANLICEDNIVSCPSANTNNDPFHFIKRNSIS
jgi:protein-serine/threonine kinase